MPPENVRTDNRASDQPRKNRFPESRDFTNCWKSCHHVLLVAAMTGNEICVSFQQLYEVPLLQVLGVPVTYVSLYPIFAGPLAMVLLNLSGHFSDKGPNHQKRKTAVIVLVSLVTLLGIALVIVANLIVLCEDSGNSLTVSANLSSGSRNSSGMRNTTLFTVTNVPFENGGFVSDGFSSMDTNMTTQAYHATIENDEDLKTEDGGSLPVTAFLGLAGLGLMDIGYDVNLAATRSCVLACSAKNDHTFILILALAMAALGGCINNVLGLVDLSAVFPFGIDGSSLAAQTTTQLMICIIVLVVCLTCTVVTALINIRDVHSHSYRPLAEEDAITKPTHSYGTFDAHSQSNDEEAEGTAETTLCNSFSGSNTMLVETDKVKETGIIGSELGISMKEDSTSQLLWHSKPGRHQSDCFTDKTDPNQNVSSLSLSSQIDSNAEDLQTCQLKKHKMNFVTACITAYLGSSVLFTYNLYAADFLGKVVMGGDSSAPHDSAEFKAYEYGVSLGAGGLLTFYCCYFLINSIHNKMLKHWGLKLDFCLSHALMSAAILSLTLSKHVAAFYVCSVVYSLQRSALFTVPFVIANNYVHEQEKIGQSVTGKTMAVVACMVPLCYCTAFLVSGPLITFTQDNGTPLILTSAFTGLAALLFLILYKP